MCSPDAVTACPAACGAGRAGPGSFLGCSSSGQAREGLVAAGCAIPSLTLIPQTKGGSRSGRCALVCSAMGPHQSFTCGLA